MAPELGLLGGITYSGSALSGELLEADTVIADRRIVRHDLDFAVEFSPVEGVAITLGVPTTLSWKFSYPNARTMAVDPIDGSGTYLASDATADAEPVTASGIEGIWLGAAVAPFAERYGVGQPITWRLDAAIRGPSKNRNLWTAVNGSRRSPPGGWGFRLAGAFSSDLGTGEPWLTAEWIRESKVEVDIVDEQGVEWATDLPLRPASTLSSAVGIEIVATEKAETGLRVAVDLSLGASYRTWEDIATGVYLPNVLDNARTIPVTAGDTVAGTAGVGVDVHVDSHVRVRSGLTFEMRTPFRPEHVYDVETSWDTSVWGWNLEVEGVGTFKK